MTTAAALGLGCGSLLLRGAAIRRTSLSSSSSSSSRNSIIITRSHELRQSSQSVDSRCCKRVVVPGPRAALHRLADETERSNASSEFGAEKPLPGARFLLTATAALTPLLFTAQVESFNSRLLLFYGVSLATCCSPTTCVAVGFLSPLAIISKTLFTPNLGLVPWHAQNQNFYFLAMSMALLRIRIYSSWQCLC